MLSFEKLWKQNTHYIHTNICVLGPFTTRGNTGCPINVYFTLKYRMSHQCLLHGKIHVNNVYYTVIWNTGCSINVYHMYSDLKYRVSHLCLLHGDLKFRVSNQCLLYVQWSEIQGVPSMFTMRWSKIQMPINVFYIVK